MVTDLESARSLRNELAALKLENAQLKDRLKRIEYHLEYSMSSKIFTGKAINGAVDESVVKDSISAAKMFLKVATSKEYGAATEIDVDVPRFAELLALIVQVSIDDHHKCNTDCDVMDRMEEIREMPKQFDLISDRLAAIP